jgi:hypothetical protein
MRLLLLLLIAAAWSPPPSTADGPLLACGTMGDDGANTEQVIGLLGFVKGVCVDQLNESYTSGYLPQSCRTAGCQRVTKLLADSCASLLREGFIATVFRPLVDPLVRMCEASSAARPRPVRHALTDPSNFGYNFFITGRTLTDGMGAAGHNSSASGTNEVTLRAAPGQVAALTLETLWLPPGYRLIVYADSGADPLVQLEGHALPPLADGGRTYRAKAPGGSLRVRAVGEAAAASAAGQPVFFSLRVPCISDAVVCSGHGSCNEATGTCRCHSGYLGAACEMKSFPGSRIILNATWGGTLNVWTEQQPQQQWELCYSSFTNETATSKSFLGGCAQYSTTLVVAHNALGYTFGGYASRPWSFR